MIWWIAFAGAVVVLLAYFRNGRNAVWGTATLALLIGLVIALVGLFRGEGFDWWTVGLAVTIGTFAGLAFDLMGRLSDVLRR